MNKKIRILFIIVNLVLLVLNLILLYSGLNMYKKIFTGQVNPILYTDYKLLMIRLLVLIGPLFWINAIVLNIIQLKTKKRIQSLESNLLTENTPTLNYKLVLSNILYFVWNAIYFLFTSYFFYLISKETKHSRIDSTEILLIIVFFLSNICSIFMIIDAINISKQLKKDE